MMKRKTFLRGLSLLLAGILSFPTGMRNISVRAEDSVETVQEVSEEKDSVTVYLAEDFEDYAGTGGASPEGFTIRGEKSWSGAYTQGGTSVSLKISDTLSGDKKEISLTKEFESNIAEKVIVDLDICSLDTNGNIFIESGGTASEGGNGKTTFATITTSDSKIKFNKKSYALPTGEWNRVSLAIDYSEGIPKTTLYVNGSEIATADLTGTKDLSYIRIRGRRLVDNSNFETLVDNVRVYSGTVLKTMEELTGKETPDVPETPENPENPENPGEDTDNTKISVYVVEDFELYNKQGSAPSGFEMTGSAAVKATSGSDTTDAGTSVRLQIADTVDLSTTPDVGLAKRFSTENYTGDLVFDWDMMTTDKNGNINIEIKDISEKGMTVANILNGNTIKIGGKTFKNIGMKENDWNRISIVLHMDGTTATATLYVNGVLVEGAQDIAINNKNGATGVNYFRIRPKRVAEADLTEDINGKKNVTVYIDNMRVYSGSELKTMDELLDLNTPDSLLDFDNDLGIDVSDRLKNALVMVEGSAHILFDNNRVKDALLPENTPCKTGDTITVPLKYAVECFGGSVTLSEQKASVSIGGKNIEILPDEGITFTGSDVMVPMETVGEILGKYGQGKRKRAGEAGILGDMHRRFFYDI